MSGAEVSISRAMEFERAQWANQLAALNEQCGKLQAANEAVIAKAREYESSAEQLTRERDGLVQSVETLRAENRSLKERLDESGDVVPGGD